MATYGIKVTACRSGSDAGHYVLREFEAADRAAAVAVARAWLVFEGYDAVHSTVDVVADGMTFKDHMRRELTNLAARMSLRYGATVEGPLSWVNGNAEPCAVVRLWMPNGHGVSVSSKIPDGSPVTSEFAAIREDKTDPYGWTFDTNAQDYPERTTVAEGADGDVAEMLEKVGNVDCADVTEGYETGDCPTCDLRAGRK